MLGAWLCVDTRVRAHDSQNQWAEIKGKEHQSLRRVKYMFSKHGLIIYRILNTVQKRKRKYSAECFWDNYVTSATNYRSYIFGLRLSFVATVDWVW